MHVLFEMEPEVYANTHVLTHAKIIIGTFEKPIILL